MHPENSNIADMREFLKALKRSIDKDVRDLNVQMSKFKGDIERFEALSTSVPEDFHAILDTGLKKLRNMESQIRKARMETHDIKLLMLQVYMIIDRRLTNLEEAEVDTEEDA